jgi:hypothetical protein
LLRYARKERGERGKFSRAFEFRPLKCIAFFNSLIGKQTSLSGLVP